MNESTRTVANIIAGYARARKIRKRDALFAYGAELATIPYSDDQGERRMTATPATIAALRPFYVRNATMHADTPERFATFTDADAHRAALQHHDPASIYIIRERNAA